MVPLNRDESVSIICWRVVASIVTSELDVVVAVIGPSPSSGCQRRDGHSRDQERLRAMDGVSQNCIQFGDPVKGDYGTAHPHLRDQGGGRDHGSWARLDGTRGSP